MSVTAKKRFVATGAHVRTYVQRSMKVEKLWEKVRRYRAQAESAYSKGEIARSNAYSRQANALAKRLIRSGLDTPVGRLPNPKKKRKNPGFFGPEARASAKRVTKIRRVQERDTREGGEIIGVQPGGFVKVKWDNRERPTLIKRSEIRRYPYLRNPVRKMDAFTRNHLAAWIQDTQRREDRARAGRLIRAFVKAHPEVIDPNKVNDWRSWAEILRLAERERENPGIMDLAGSVQAIEYLADKAGPGKRRRRNPKMSEALRQAKRDLSKYTTQYERLYARWVSMMDRGLHGKKQFAQLARNVEIARENAEKAARAVRYEQDRQVKNPTVAAMSRTFQGSANGQTQEYYASDYAPRLDFSRGGKLVFLKLAGTTIRVPGAVVAIDPKASRFQGDSVKNRIWIAGSDKRAMFKRKAARKGELLDYGAVDAICYLTGKKHIEKGRTFEYAHEFGEEGGRKPKLMIDHDGMPILKGGDYKIESRGIVN